MTVNRTKGTTRRTPQISDNILAAVLGVVDAEGKRKPIEAPIAKPAEPAPVRDTKQPMRISDGALSRARRIKRSEEAAAKARVNPFEVYKPAPGVLPQGAEPTLAMDTALGSWAQDSYSNAWNFANPFGGAFAEGVGFLGYAYLSELTQRPEYRRISERIATEMTRKWIRLTIAGEADDDEEEDSEGAEDKAPPKAKAKPKPARDPKELDDPEDDEDQDGDDAAAGGAEEEDDEPTPEELAQRKRNEALQKKLKKIEADMKRLNVRGAFKTVAEFDGWMGRSHLYIDTGDSQDEDELLTDLGNGSDKISKNKFKKGSLRGLKHVEPIWCYPVNYNANDPLADDWYNPQIWFAMAKRIHVSRLLTFVGRPLPDILKPAYAFGGLSMSQMAKPYVDNWLRTRQAVTALIESFSVSGVYTNAQSLLQGGGEEVLDRIELFNVTRTNAGCMVLDKDTEEFFNVSTPLGTLDALQAQSQEQMSSVSGIPLIVLLGITPTGLNASSEGELRVFYDYIHAMQESLFRDKLHRVLCFIQLNLFGEVDPAIGFEFEPLWSLDEKGEAEVDKIKMETRNGYVDMGAVSNEEVRKILIEDEDSEFNGLDPDDVPDLQQEEQDGLMPGGGAGGAGGMGGNNDNKEVEGAADDMIELADDVYAMDGGLYAMDEGQFDESKHKRDAGGKFSATGAGGGAQSQGADPELTFKSKKEHIGHLLMKGTTAKTIMETMGWPSVSMPAQAKSLGMKLEKYTENGVVKYKGTPMTDAEKAAAKAEEKGKQTDKAAQQILKNAGLAKVVKAAGSPKSEPSSTGYKPPKDYAEFVEHVDGFMKKGDGESAANLMKYNPAWAEQLVKEHKTAAEKADVAKPAKAPAKAMIPPATGPEMEKAKKSTSLSLHLVPGEKPEVAGSPQMEMAQANLKTFNEKYAGKDGLTAEQLSEKVHDFKQLQKSINAGGKEEAAHKTEIQAAAKKKLVEEAKKQAAEAAAKQAKEKAKVAEQHKEVRAALGIKKEDTAAIEAFDSFIDHFGGADTAIKQFKSWQATAEKEAKDNPGKGYEKLSGFEMGCIKGYTGPKSSWINDAIINDSMTPAQFMFEKVLNSALDKLPKISGKIVRRGLTMDAKTLAKMEPGKVWTHRNFASSNDKGWGGNTKLHIMTSGKGAAYVGDISSHEHENETLFKSNLRLMIDKTETKDGVLHVHCREL